MHKSKRLRLTHLSMCRAIALFGMVTASGRILGEEVMIPGQWVPVSSAVEVEGVTRYEEGTILGGAHDGAWAAFGPFDLSDGLVDRVELRIAATATVGRVVLLLDRPTGSPVGEVPIVATGGSATYAVCGGHAEQLSGTHRLVLLFRGGDNLCKVRAFRLLKPDQKGSPEAILQPPPETAPAGFQAEMESIVASHRDGIESNRTTWITVRAAPGAAVSVKQTRHAFEFGTAISRRAFVPTDNMGESDQEQYKRILRANFNSVVHENAMKWYSNEKQQDEHTYADAETMLTWCETNGLSTRGHCVYWGRDKVVQQWIKELDDEALCNELKQRASDYMGRFAGRVGEHDVNNEMLHCHYFEKRLGPGIREQMFAWCQAYAPRAILYVNDYSILSGGDTERYVEQIDGFLKAGMNVGGIGVQGHFGARVDGPKIREKLDLLAQFGLPIKITEFDVNTKDEHAKARALVTLYATAFSHPAVEGIYMWGFCERSHWRPDAALWNADWSETLAAEQYRKLLFGRWWTDFEGKADAAGTCKVRVFFGEHDVTVNGQTRRIKIGKSAADTIIDCRVTRSGHSG